MSVQCTALQPQYVKMRKRTLGQLQGLGLSRGSTARRMGLIKSSTVTFTLRPRFSREYQVSGHQALLCFSLLRWWQVAGHAPGRVSWVGNPGCVVPHFRMVRPRAVSTVTLPHTALCHCEN